MYPNAQHKSLVRTMSYLEARHFTEQLERHVADLDDVSTFVRLRQTADDHVGVADCLHLHIERMHYIG